MGLVEATRAHVDAAHDYLYDLERRCDLFADAPWFLDCSDVPCFVGVPTSHLEERDLVMRQLICFDDLMSTQHSTRLSGEDGVSVLPLTALMEHPDHWAMWKEREVYRVGDALKWTSDRVK